MTKELPVLFNGVMVRAILDGRKTQTRRPMKIQPPEWAEHAEELAGRLYFEFWKTDRFHEDYVWPNDLGGVKSPFGQPGDVLWVRESAKVSGWLPNQRKIELKYIDGAVYEGDYPERLKWTPVYGHKVPNGCYRESCRIKLKVKRIWVERVQDISTENCISEGRMSRPLKDYQTEESHCKAEHTAAKIFFKNAWDSIYGTWDDNPWIWCCEFEVMEVVK